MLENNNFGQEILAKIKEKNISPKPKWRFLAKNYFVWTLGVLALTIGALAVAVIIYFLQSENWEAYRHADGGWLNYVIIALPYFWIIFLGLFIGVFYINFKYTKKGYRYPISTVIMASIAGSILLGAAFHGLGMGQVIDDLMSRQAPFYDKLMNQPMQYWAQPEEGRLTGMLISQAADKGFVLIDLEQREWQVDISEVEDKQRVILEIGRPFRFLGKMVSASSFKASEAFPVGPGREFIKRHGIRPEGNMPRPPFLPDDSRQQFMKDCGSGLTGLWDKYPELKQFFEASLLADKEKLKTSAQVDPDLLIHLERLGVGQEIINQLK